MHVIFFYLKKGFVLIPDPNAGRRN